MATPTFTLEFPSWRTQKDAKGRDVIIAVDWVLSATDGVNTVKAFSNVKFPLVREVNANENSEDVPEFILKKDLTYDIIASWVKPAMGYDAYVAQLTSNLRSMSGIDMIPTYEVPHFNPPAPKPTDSSS